MTTTSHEAGRKHIARLFSLFSDQCQQEHAQLLVKCIREGYTDLKADMLDHPIGDEWFDFARDGLAAHWQASRGHLYAAANPVTPNFIKVGLTARSPEKRLQQLNNSAVIGTYIFVETWAVHDRFYLEKAAHRALRALGIACHKEHFASSWKTVCPVVAEVIAADRRLFELNGFEVPA